MKTTLLGLTALALITTSTHANNPRLSVGVKPYEERGLKNPPTGFEVSATASREFDRDKNSRLSWVWFGGKISNKTSRGASYTLTISFFDAKGNELGGTSFKGSVKAQGTTTLPDKETVMATSLVKEVYNAKYLLEVK